MGQLLKLFRLDYLLVQELIYFLPKKIQVSKIYQKGYPNGDAIIGSAIIIKGNNTIM